MARTKRPTRWGKTALYLAEQLEARGSRQLEAKFVRAWARKMFALFYREGQAGRHFRHMLDGGWVVSCGKSFRFTAAGVRAIKAIRTATVLLDLQSQPVPAIVDAPPPRATGEDMSALFGSGYTN